MKVSKNVLIYIILHLITVAYMLKKSVYLENHVILFNLKKTQEMFVCMALLKSIFV